MSQQHPDKPLLFNRIFIVYDKDSRCTEEDFREKFGGCGEIHRIQIQRDKATGREKGYCYIHFDKTSEACTAVEELHNTAMQGNTRPIKVFISQDKKDNLEIDVEEDEMLKRIFIRHPKNFVQSDIEDEYAKFGDITWLYILRDKQTRHGRGCSFVKYTKQSQAARAIEESDEAFKARWADVRSLNFHESKHKSKNEGMMGGDMDMMGGGGGGGGMMGGMGGGGGMGMGMGDMGGRSQGGASAGGGVLDFITVRQSTNNTRLEALVPSSMNSNQVYNLFNVAPGLKSCSLDQTTGIVKLEYSNIECASYAKDRIDGMDINGQSIALRVPRPTGLQSTAMQLQDTLAQLGGANNPQISTLMASLQQVTAALQNQGVDDDGSSGDVIERVDWCSVPLPGKKQTTPLGVQAAKMFVVALPHSFPDEMLQNLLCRFGNLINCRFQPRSRYGFALFGSKDSAENAVRTLHEKTLFWDGKELTFKIAFSKDPEKNGVDNDADAPVKRKRMI